jgi:hypothetical protein
MSMSKGDATKWIIPDGSTHLDYVRIDEAKSNLGALRPGPRWYRRESVILAGYRGGRLPILRPIDLERKAKSGSAAKQDLAASLGTVIRDHLGANQWHPLSAIIPHLPRSEADRLSDRNRSRALDEAFDGASDAMTDTGILKRATSPGRRGTTLMLVSPQTPQ